MRTHTHTHTHTNSHTYNGMCVRFREREEVVGRVRLVNVITKSDMNRAKMLK